MANKPNLIDQAYSVYERHQRERGFPTDEAAFVGGVMSCFGVLTGRVDVGAKPDTTILQLFELIQRELDDYRQQVVVAQRDERRNGG